MLKILKFFIIFLLFTTPAVAASNPLRPNPFDLVPEESQKQFSTSKDQMTVGTAEGGGNFSSFITPLLSNPNQQSGPGGGGGGNSDGSQAIADRAKQITDNLQSGFNNYFNKSPDYPDLWNAALFAQNPNPTSQKASIGSDDMFWCNWLVVKSYEVTGQTVPFSFSGIIPYFQGQNKYIEGDSLTYLDAHPGAAVFFKIPADSSGLAHVGIVYNVSPDGIATAESNAPYKSMFYPTDTSGHFQIIGSGSSTIKVASFGTP
ncbi:MAG: hypothetical protein NTZ93_04245 [Candidatus Beckwithbacteria bacterium]|nr:hypothetical protein [Candidatus Beckwithbacteria bacterium]